MKCVGGCECVSVYVLRTHVSNSSSYIGVHKHHILYIMCVWWTARLNSVETYWIQCLNTEDEINYQIRPNW